jgi:toxin ParE1/3/4
LDIEAAVDYYEAEAGPEVARRFLESVRASFRAIRERPGTGSPRYAFALDLGDLRSRPVAGFPYLVFYTEQEKHFEVWRVLHARSDMAARLGEGG